MAELNWSLLQPVDTGAQVQQGFATGMAMVKHVQTANALKDYTANPDDPKALSALTYYDPDTATKLQTARETQRKNALETTKVARTQAIGGLIANGNTAGARTAALAGGDIDLAKTISGLSDEDQKKAGDFWKNAGSVAYSLQQEPDQAKRHALWDQSKQILASQGAPQELLDKFDPDNPAQLQAAITTAQQVTGLIDQNKVTWHQTGEQGSFATDAMGRPIGSQNPYATGSASPAPSTPAGAGGFDAAVGRVLGHEGGYSPHDMNGSPVNFGINQGANPDVDVSKLTRDQAVNLYHDRYWVPSGAEKLPANMQAPYFDVYIRNPAFAKHALSESGGDPTRFMDLADSYFGHLASTPSGQKYAHAWQNRDANNRAVATGGVNAAVTSVSHEPITKDQFDRLPSGAVFTAPDGSRRVKPYWPTSRTGGRLPRWPQPMIRRSRASFPERRSRLHKRHLQRVIIKTQLTPTPLFP
jgi:hypothetical protein